MTTETAPAALANAGRPKGSAYATRPQRAWGITVLAMVWFLAAVDRNILSVLLVPIQKDLGVTDTAMGALTGGVFALTFAVAGLPLSWLADRSSRRNFLAASVAVWSLMTALCGLAGNYLQLLLARIGVAGGEAAHAPASMSMVADIFPESKRGAAVSVLAIGSAAGFAGGAFLAGAAADAFGWRAAMFAVGLPGLMVSVLLLLTVPDPARADGHAVLRPSVLATLKRISRIRTLPPLLGATILLNIGFMGYLSWMPAFLTRVHHLSGKEVGGVFGLIVAGGIVANFYAGILSDWLSKRGMRWRSHYCVAVIVLAAPLLGAGVMASTVGQTIGFLVAYSLIAGGLTPVSNVMALSLAPAQIRTTFMALMALAIALLASGAGPVLVGKMSDLLKPEYGDLAIRYALLLSPASIALSGLLFFIAGLTLERDAAEAEAESAGAGTVTTPAH